VDLVLALKKVQPAPKDKKKVNQPMAKVGSAGNLAESGNPVLEEPDKQKKMTKLNTFLKSRPDKDSLVKKGLIQDVEPPPAPGSITLKLEVFEQLCNFLSKDCALAHFLH